MQKLSIIRGRDVLPVVLLCGALTGTAIAQGNDCSNPDTTGLTGTGTFLVDTTGTTTSGFSGGSTCGGAVYSDSFHVWTAPQDGAFVLMTVNTDLGGASTGEAIRVHDGVDCAATCLAFDSGEEPAVTLLDLVAGQQLLIQVGSAGGVATGTIQLEITHHGLPANDTCASPTVVGLGVHPFSNLGATSTQFNGGGLPCGVVGQALADVFFLFTPATSGSFRVDTLSGDLDTILNVHQGSDCNASCLMTNHLGSSTSVGSRVDLTSSAGSPYLIQVGGWRAGDISHAGALEIATLPTPPPNDSCTAPTVLPSVTGPVPYDNTIATASGFDGGQAPCAASGMHTCPAPDLFFVWSPPVTGDYDVESSAVGVDTQILNLHVGSDCNATCFGMDTAHGGIDVSARLALVGAPAGQPYMVQVGAWLWGDTTSVGVLEFRDLPLPTNSTCDAPVPIAGEGSWTWDNFHPGVGTSGFDGGDPTTCPSDANGFFSPLSPIEQDLFFAWTAQCDGDYRFHTIGSETISDTTISVHTGSDCTATCLTWNGTMGTKGSEADLSLKGVTAGTQLLIQVGASNPSISGGRGVLTIIQETDGCDSTSIQVACDPAMPHYHGESVTLASSHLGALTGSGLHLEAHDGPPGEFGVLLVAEDTSVQWPLFNGLLCIAPPYGRYDGWSRSGAPSTVMNSLGLFDSTGTFQILQSSATSGSGFDVPHQLPTSIAQEEVLPGDTWGFQLWYRDDDPQTHQPSSNFSNLLVVTFP